MQPPLPDSFIVALLIKIYSCSLLTSEEIPVRFSYPSTVLRSSVLVILFNGYPVLWAAGSHIIL